jgi:hypothetical protein
MKLGAVSRETKRCDEGRGTYDESLRDEKTGRE